jgi:hypothetical protein
LYSIVKRAQKIDEVSHAPISFAFGVVVYNDSFKIFTQDFSYRNSEDGLEASVARLQAWFARLDADMKAAIEALTDEQIATQKIEPGFQVSIESLLEVYLQALLIFAGKFTIYWRVMGKPMTALNPPQVARVSEKPRRFSGGGVSQKRCSTRLARL